jgi:hypothetical protein
LVLQDFMPYFSTNAKARYAYMVFNKNPVYYHLSVRSLIDPYLSFVRI